jgi:hypothetical protein
LAVRLSKPLQSRRGRGWDSEPAACRGGGA